MDGLFCWGKPMTVNEAASDALRSTVDFVQLTITPSGGASVPRSTMTMRVLVGDIEEQEQIYLPTHELYSNLEKYFNAMRRTLLDTLRAKCPLLG